MSPRLAVGIGGLGGLGVLGDIATSKNFQIASREDRLGYLGKFLSDAALARFGPVGAGVATASAFYKVGNLLEEGLEIGEKLGGSSTYGSFFGTNETEGRAAGLEKVLQDRLASRAVRKGVIRSGRRSVRSRRAGGTSLIRRDPLESWKDNYKKALLARRYSEDQADIIISNILDRYALSRRYMNFSSGYVPNFAGGMMSEMMDIATNPDYSGFRNAVPQMSNYYPNVIKNSAEIEVPATEVYNRMGFFGAKPKNPAQQYAILNPAQQAALGYASEGFVPNFAMEQFASAIGDAFQKAFSPYADKMGSSSNTSNVINVSDQRSYQENTGKIDGIMEFLYKQFPKEMGKFGAVFKK